jgi:uncharacterized protein
MPEASKFPLIECTFCNKLGIPPQYVCRHCGNGGMRETYVNGKGTIYTYTTIRIAPEAYRKQAPYDIAIVELSPDLRVTARILPKNSDTPLQVGQSVVFHHADMYGYWFNVAGDNV